MAVDLPVHLWYQAIPQSEQQLLILRKYNVKPKVSAYTQVYGPRDYKAAPFFQIRTETLVHEKPNRRGTFSDHSSKWYVLETDFED